MDEPLAHTSPGEQRFDASLKKRTARSIAWTIAQTGGDQFFSFLVFVMMARLLSKIELGTFAIAIVFLDIGRVIASAGVNQRVAQIKSFAVAELDTIFWANMLQAACYSLLLIASGWMLGDAFHAPLLQSVLPWMAIPVLLSAAGNTHMALRLREFGHSTLAFRSLLAGLLGGGAAVVAALAGAGIWALVVQRVVRESIGTALAWTAYRWRPRVTFNLKQAKTNLSIGVSLAWADIAYILTIRLQDVIVGAVIGPIAVSIYRVAWRCTEFIGPGIVAPFATVGLQTFARLQDNRDELRSAYTDVLRKCSIASVPALAGYGIIGPWLVPALFGSQWQAAGWLTPALIPLAIPFTLSGFVLALLSSLGEIAWQRHLAMLDLITTLAASALAVSHGLLWVAIAYSIRSWMLIPVQLYVVRKVSGIGLYDHLAAFAPAVLAAAMMTAVTVPLLLEIGRRTLPALAGVCIVSAAVYGLLLLIMLPYERRQLGQALRSALASPRA